MDNDPKFWKNKTNILEHALIIKIRPNNTEQYHMKKSLYSYIVLSW